MGSSSPIVQGEAWWLIVTIAESNSCLKMYIHRASNKPVHGALQILHFHMTLDTQYMEDHASSWCPVGIAKLTPPQYCTLGIPTAQGQFATNPTAQ